MFYLTVPIKLNVFFFQVSIIGSNFWIKTGLKMLQRRGDLPRTSMSMFANHRFQIIYNQFPILQ